jgi:hypothetical protein
MAASSNPFAFASLGVAWVVVGIPLLWGTLITMEKAAGLFK